MCITIPLALPRVLFCSLSGRTDLPLASPQDMVRSLVKIMDLDDQTTVYPGFHPL